MKTLASLTAVVFALVAFVPAVQAQAATGFSGKWEGTMTRQLPDGTEGNATPLVLNLVQKGKALTGTGGSPTQQWPAEKGAVTAGKATFEVQQPNGPLFKFTVSIVKGRLVGEAVAHGPDGAPRGKARVDAGKAAAGVKK